MAITQADIPPDTHTTDIIVVPQRNPVTLKAHQRETWWQIVFPVLIAAALALTLTGLTVYGGPGIASVAADYALILLLLPIVLSVVALTGVLIYGLVLLGRLIRVLPEYTFPGHQFFRQVYENVDTYADKVAGGVIRAKLVTEAVTAAMREAGIPVDDAPARPNGAGKHQPEPPPATPPDDPYYQRKPSQIYPD